MDGTITVDEAMVPIELELFGDIPIAQASSQVIITFNEDAEVLSGDDVAGIIDVVPNITIVPCFDELAVTPIVVSVSRSYLFPNEWIYDELDIEFTTPNIKIRTEHIYEAETCGIDRGVAEAVEVPLSDFDTIVDLEVE